MNHAPGSKEWHQERMSGIGASECAAALGLSKWKTPLDVYLAKITPDTPRPDTPATRRGRMMEDVVLNYYEEDVAPVERSLPRVVSKEHPFMFASLDARRKDDLRPVEAKTVGIHGLPLWGEPGTDEVPEDYLFQVMHQMIVVRAMVCDLAALKADDNFHVYTIEHDPELAGLIVEGLAEFWRRVENREPPEPTCVEDVEKLYRRSKAEGIEASPAIIQALDELRQVKNAMKPLTAQEKRLKDEIKMYLAEKDTLLVGGEAVVTWKTSKDSTRFDANALKREQPDIYKQYLISTPGSRRMLIKGDKDNGE